MTVKTYIGKIQKIEEIGSKIKIFQVKIDKDFNFIPGQFMMFGIEVDGKPLKRAFSIANTNKDDYLEFCIKVEDKGRLSPLLFNLNIGDLTILEGPYGNFNYKESENDIVFIAAGVGVTPLMSMIRELIQKKINKKITLIYGTREELDLCYIKELKDYNKYGKLNLVLILSRPNEKWKGEKGHVQDILTKYLKNINQDFYICGPPLMVTDTIKKLQELGIKEEQINKEKWG